MSNNTTNNTQEIDNVLKGKNEWVFNVYDNEIFGKHVEISCPNEQLRVAEIPYIDDTAKENAANIVKSYNEQGLARCGYSRLVSPDKELKMNSDMRFTEARILPNPMLSVRHG